ncbi:hypothetical protein [Methylobacterium sp. WL19]|nr:hypothetical protein [Methylobacterium sp. WL19]
MTAAATRACIVAMLAWLVFIGLQLGARDAAPFETTIPWSAGR